MAVNRRKFLAVGALAAGVAVSTKPLSRLSDKVTAAKIKLENPGSNTPPVQDQTAAPPNTVAPSSESETVASRNTETMPRREPKAESRNTFNTKVPSRQAPERTNYGQQIAAEHSFTPAVKHDSRYSPQDNPLAHRPSGILESPRHVVRSEAQLSREQSDSGVVDNVLAADNPHMESAPVSDVILSDTQLLTLKSVFNRLSRLQKHVGYGNFNIIGWDDSLLQSRQAKSIGKFTALELDFIEEVFAASAANMGFYGDKIITKLSERINKSQAEKIPDTGHYLFKGKALETYKKIRHDVGDTVVLTSGIRGVVKQIYLFFNKAIEVDGNLSLASFSLAPPGHSYHAIGDFDVGKVGFGHKNFTSEFSQTEEFKRLSEYGYFDIRYPQNNPFGVRYEPWHIKVV